MKRKLIAYLLIVTGLIPVIAFGLLKIISRVNGPDAGNVQIEIQNENLYNFITEYGTGIVIGGFWAGIIMIVIGSMILKNIKMSEKELAEETSLDPGERIVFRQKSFNSIVVVTSQRVRYYGFYNKELKKSVDEMPETDREDYLLSDVKMVKPVNYRDVAWSKWARNTGFGIQLQLRNGRIVNIPAGDQEAVAEQIDIQLKMR